MRVDEQGKTLKYSVVINIDYIARWEQGKGRCYKVKLHCGHEQIVRAFNLTVGRTQVFCPDCTKKGR